MRIVQLITRPQRRGAEIFAVQLAEQLKLLGHQLWVVSILKGPGGLEFSGDFIKLDLDGISKLDVKGFKKLADLLREIGSDIVQANAADTLRYAVGARLSGAGAFKLIYRNANTISQFIATRMQLLFNKLLHSRVDAVISVSDHSRKDYQKLFNPKQIISIPIGIDPLEIQSKIEKPTSGKDGYLLFVGSMVAEKDPLGMLDIFKEIVKVNPSLKLKFLGSGPLQQIVTERIYAETLMDSIELIPNQSNIFPLLSKAVALLMPSKIEGLPGVILEAMYCQVPVIAYNVGGVSEVLINKETGWLIEAGDINAFGESILEVLNTTSAELQKITSTAKALVLKNYQIDQIAKEFESYYFTLLNSKI